MAPAHILGYFLIKRKARFFPYFIGLYETICHDSFYTSIRCHMAFYSRYFGSFPEHFVALFSY